MNGSSRRLLCTNFRSLSATWAFFCVLVATGLANFRNYGISWEAPALRLNGGNSLIYVVDLLGLDIVPNQYRQFPPMGENGMFDHGVAYDMLLGVIETMLRITDPMQIYQMRSLINFFVFVLGTLSIYFIVYRRLGSRNVALLASLFFVLSPRIFAAGFYSPSDMVFSSFFALGVNLSLRFLEKANWKNALLAGVASGFATDIRLMGIIIFPLVLLLFLALNFEQLKRNLSSAYVLALYLIAALFTIYLFFPYLWASPASRLMEVFLSLSRYPWGGENLYFGELVPANDLPWHYIPVWILITTPVFYLFLFALGIIKIFRDLVRQKAVNNVTSQDILFTSLVFIPIFVVIILNSVLYDTWRHLFFIYPYILVVAVIGWKALLPKPLLRVKATTVKKILTSAAVTPIALWMILNNPNQHLFFNSLAGNSNLQEKWEMDYLGLSNREGLQYLLTKDQRPLISVSVVSFTAFDMSLKILPSRYADRFRVVSLTDEPDYIVNNYRGVRETFIPPRGYVMEKSFYIDDSKYLEIWKRSLDE